MTKLMRLGLVPIVLLVFVVLAFVFGLMLIAGAPPTSFVATGALALISLTVIVTLRRASEASVVNPHRSASPDVRRSSEPATSARSMNDDFYAKGAPVANKGVISAMRWAIGLTMRAIDTATIWVEAPMRGTGRPMAQPI